MGTFGTLRFSTVFGGWSTSHSRACTSSVPAVSQWSSSPRSMLTARPETPKLAPVSTAPTVPETFPPADPAAKNFLLTGADNGACVDPNSPYAPAFGDAESGRVGERSDTIIFGYIPKSMDRAYMISIPRDSYVEIVNQTGDGISGRDKINYAYAHGGAQALVKTVNRLTGVPIDYPVIVDFHAVHKITDLVGDGLHERGVGGVEAVALDIRQLEHALAAALDLDRRQEQRLPAAVRRP